MFTRIPGGRGVNDNTKKKNGILKLGWTMV